MPSLLEPPRIETIAVEIDEQGMGRVLRAVLIRYPQRATVAYASNGIAYTPGAYEVLDKETAARIMAAERRAD